MIHLSLYGYKLHKSNPQLLYILKNCSFVFIFYFPAGGKGGGTTLLTGFVVFKYAKIAFISSSVKFLYICHGIGGNKFLALAKPLNFPSLNASINCCSVQLPIPV